MGKRVYIGVLFRCCNLYGRAYLNSESSAYLARCPRCAQPIKIEISPYGSESQFFSIG